MNEGKDVTAECEILDQFDGSTLLYHQGNNVHTHQDYRLALEEGRIVVWKKQGQA